MFFLCVGSRVYMTFVWNGCKQIVAVVNIARPDIESQNIDCALALFVLISQSLIV